MASVTRAVGGWALEGGSFEWGKAVPAASPQTRQAAGPGGREAPARTTPADSRCPPLSPAAPRELGSDGRSHRPAGRFEGSRRYGTGQPGKLAQSGGGGHGPLVRGVGSSPASASPRGDRLQQPGPARQGDRPGTRKRVV